MTTYKAKTLSGAQRRVRQLLKQRKELTALLEQYHRERQLLAMLAAEGPAFSNPLVVYEAKKIRDAILARLNLNPDGSPR